MVKNDKKELEVESIDPDCDEKVSESQGKASGIENGQKRKQKDEVEETGEGEIKFPDDSGSLLSKKKKKFRFIFKKDIDLVSFLALLLSLMISMTSLGWHVVKLHKGAQLELYPTDFILLIAEQINKGYPVLRIGVRLNYINKADPEYHAAIKNEYIEFTINDVTYRLESFNRVFFDRQKKTDGCAEIDETEKRKEMTNGTFWGKVKNQDKEKIYYSGNLDEANKIVVKNIRPINLVLKGKSGISSDTFFSPVRYYYGPQKNYSYTIEWGDLIKMLERDDNEATPLNFIIGVETWHGKNYRMKYKVIIDGNDIANMDEKGMVSFSTTNKHLEYLGKEVLKN